MPQNVHFDTSWRHFKFCCQHKWQTNLEGQLIAQPESRCQPDYYHQIKLCTYLMILRFFTDKYYALHANFSHDVMSGTGSVSF